MRANASKIWAGMAWGPRYRGGRPEWTRPRSWWRETPNRPVTVEVTRADGAWIIDNTATHCLETERNHARIIHRVRVCVLDLTGKPARSIRVVRR